MLHKNWTKTLAFMVVILGITFYVAPTVLPSLPTARGTSRTIYLVGYYQAWNYSQTSGQNPTITVTQGDSITIQLSSGDISHLFLLDFDGDGVFETADCSATGTMDICSGLFSTTPTSVSFTANTVGTYTYYCTIHYPAMIGKLKVLPSSTPDFTVSSNPSSLSIVQGSNANSTITVSSINNFAGSIMLSAASSPSGPTTGFNSTMLTVPAEGTAHSKLTVSTTSGTPVNSYSITVTAKNSTTFSRTTTVTITVISPTTTQVVCIPSSVVVNQASTCTATVTDTFPAGATTPGGEVTFTLTGAGSLSGNSCMLASSYCSTTFASSTSGIGTLIGHYSGDLAHNASASTLVSIAVNLRSTTTSVSCGTPIDLNQPSTCIAVVSDSSTAGTVVTPTGSVSFTATGVGSVTPSSCTLSSGTSAGTATCNVIFTSAIPGTASVTANYAGSNMIQSGSRSTPAGITVLAMVPKDDTTTSLSCETPVLVNQGSKCIAKVTDTSMPGSTPTGSVTFTVTGGSSLSPTSCNLSNGGCSVTFTPSIAGKYTVTSSYGGDPSHSSSVSATSMISVPNPEFSINADPTGLTVTQGSSSTSSITLSAQNGFSGVVALTAASTSGITVTFTPTTIYPLGSSYTTQTSTMAISIDSSVAAGSYTIVVTGTSGSLTHHLNVPLTVNSSPSPVSPAPAIFGLQPLVFYGIVGGVVAVVAVGAGATIFLRKRKP